METNNETVKAKSGRWVTFYWSILAGVSDVTYHKTREDCRKFFKAHYKSYFMYNTPFNVSRVPCRYGFGHRAFHAMSTVAFKKNWQKKEREAV